MRGRRRRPGRGFYRPLLLAVPALSGALGCAREADPPGLRVGPALVPAAEVAAARERLRAVYPELGDATLTWYLLDGDLGAAALLHHRFPEESASARRRAEAWVAELQAGRPWEELRAEWAAAHPELDFEPIPNPIAPYLIGSEPASWAAVLEPGAWVGPLKTLQGWEVVRLLERLPGHGTAGVATLDRLVAPVGDQEARRDARADWSRLPLSGDPELLDALPLEFRVGRTPGMP